MESLLDPMAWLSALGIFLVRVLNIALDTVRMISVMRGKKAIAWVLGVVTSVLFVLSIGWVMSDLSDPLKIAAYSVGFAYGTIIGMNLEKKMAMGHTFLTIISSNRGAALVEALRGAGYAVTEIPARGKDGNGHHARTRGWNAKTWSKCRAPSPDIDPSGVHHLPRY